MEPKEFSTSSISSVDSPVIRKDYEGDFRAVAGTKLISIVHENPYHWTATLSFTGDARPVIASLGAHLADLGFSPAVGRESIIKVEDGKVSGCLTGEIDTSGNGTCTLRAGLPGGRGLVDISVDKASAKQDGLVTIDRRYEHRLPADELGPPFPPAQPTERVTILPRSQG